MTLPERLNVGVCILANIEEEIRLSGERVSASLARESTMPIMVAPIDGQVSASEVWEAERKGR